MTVKRSQLVLVDPHDVYNEDSYKPVEKLSQAVKQGGSYKVNELSITAGATLRVLKFERKRAGKDTQDPHYGDVAVLYKDEVRFAFDF
jgi:hypothetical protein